LPALISPPRLSGRDADSLKDQIERSVCEDSLYDFLRRAWPAFDPAPFVGGWHLAAISDHLEAVTNGQIKRLLINVRPRSGKTSLVAVAWPVWTWALETDPDYPLRGPSVRFLFGSYGANKAQEDAVTARRLIASEWFRRLWGDRVQIAKDRDNAERYDTTVSGSRISTGIPESLGKGGMVKALDDPQKTDEVESDKMREQVVKNYREIWQTRSNDPVNSAEVMVCQRQAEDDLSGFWLNDLADDVVHLCIPAWHESDRVCRTFIDVEGRVYTNPPKNVDVDVFWEDPRKYDGESFWPERYAPTQRAKDEALGPFAFCTPAESPVLMADLSMKPIGQIRVGDAVIGWQKRPNTGVGDATTYRRQTLVSAEVVAVSRSVRPVVKMTLDSGRVVRCTPDHKWYRGEKCSPSQPERENYLPAKIGSPLCRVCDSELPILSDEDARDAGWLIGFFDGKGSATIAKRKDELADYDGHVQLAFHQTAERNLPLCQKLERLLTKFGFDYRIFYREMPADKAHWQKRHHYYLVGDGLPLLQRFLHIVQPTKWRDRILEGALRGRFIRGRERVVSIESDGEEEVFGLTTTTGNYVVWGLASSNSGQIQQRPEPRGGGIIKRMWWQAWPPDEDIDLWTTADGQTGYPEWELQIAYLDSAFTTKEANDYCALARLGVFGNSAGTPCAMLCGAWQERLSFHELIQRVLQSCRSWKTDMLIIENKAGGNWVMEELLRHMAAGEWMIELDTPVVDKQSRAHAVVPLFAGKLVYAPFAHDKGEWRVWAEMAISNIEKFPTGRHDDIVDAVVGGLGYLRRNGLIKLKQEAEEDEIEEKRFKGNRSTIAEEYGVA
jgi:predicted phage terminase large subunit-like protein